MATDAAGGGAADDATVDTSPPPETAQVQQMREAYAVDAETAVKTIEAKIAGMQASLKTAKADAKRLRAEADGSAD
jgi:hypothetical protein